MAVQSVRSSTARRAEPDRIYNIGAYRSALELPAFWSKPRPSQVSRNIPPLNPLHVFEVAARLGNFTKAAEELNVTQSAVSRQIATLEDYLKVRLFYRDRGGVSLTKVGRSYFREIQSAFAAIAASTSRVLQEGGAQQLHVNVFPTFAVKWLIPRMKSFNADYPLIDVRISSQAGPVDFTGDNIQLAIRLLPDAEAEDHYIRLFSDVIQPVCSPGLLRDAAHPLRRVEDLAHFRLLHAQARRNDWREWLASVAHEDLAEAAGVEFSSSVLTYQAAAEGLGVAMGQIRLLEHDLGTGRLVTLFEHPLERAVSYYIVWPKNFEPDHKARAFIYWLMRQAGVADEQSDAEAGFGGEA